MTKEEVKEILQMEVDWDCEKFERGGEGYTRWNAIGSGTYKDRRATTQNF